MSAILVTGAGTDIGKTYVACALLRAIRKAGRQVSVLKPVISGTAAFGDVAFDTSDTARLLRAAGVGLTPDAADACSPWRFAAALSPDMAAAQEGRRLAMADVALWCRRQMEQSPLGGVMLIEGVGGVMSPIAEDGLVLDWIVALERPALLVVGAYLGAISHALTALAALRARGVEVAAVVVSETENAPVSLEATMTCLAKYAGGVALYGMAREAPAPDALVQTLLLDQAPRKTSATA